MFTLWKDRSGTVITRDSKSEGDTAFIEDLNKSEYVSPNEMLSFVFFIDALHKPAL